MASGCMVRCCTCSSIIIVLSVIIFILSLFLLPCMPPYVHFPEYNGVKGESNIQDKEHLLNGVEHFYEVRGPQALAVRDGQIYTGLLGGNIVRVDPDSKDIISISRLGHPLCESETDGEVCGRPTGMEFYNDKLYIVDAYHGLFSVDVNSGQWEHLAGGQQRIGGLRIMLAFDLTIGNDGRVYWTDASTQTSFENIMLEFLAEPSGRLLRYDINTNRSDVLMGRLHSPTGVLLSPDESYLLVVESGKDRILRYYLKGKKSGTYDIFTEGLPGIPIKIRNIDNDKYLLTLAIKHPNLLSWIRNYPSLSKALMRFFESIKYMFSSVNHIVKNNISRDALYMVGNPQMVSDLLPGGAILILDKNGNIINDMDSNDENLGIISQVEIIDDSLFFASPYNPYLGRLNFTNEIKDRIFNNNITVIEENTTIFNINEDEDSTNQIEDTTDDNNITQK